MSREETGGCLAFAVAGVVMLIALVIAGWGLGWFSLITGRPMAKYSEETRKEVYDTSRQYEQGTNRDIARYCEQMRGADSIPSHKAVAALIRSTASTFDGRLTDDNTACIAEAKGN